MYYYNTIIYIIVYINIYIYITIRIFAFPVSRFVRRSTTPETDPRCQASKVPVRPALSRS